MRQISFEELHANYYVPQDKWLVTEFDDIIGKLCSYKRAVVLFCFACFETEFPSMPQTGLQFAILLLLPLSVGTGNGGQNVSHKVIFFIYFSII